jgi:hypothetical protein
MAFSRLVRSRRRSFEGRTKYSVSSTIQRGERSATCKPGVHDGDFSAIRAACSLAGTTCDRLAKNADNLPMCSADIVGRIARK